MIDYATSDDRSDFLDIWLMANCYFCITTGTGLDEVAGFWGIPSVFVNLLPLKSYTAIQEYHHSPKEVDMGREWEIAESLKNICNMVTRRRTNIGIKV